MVDKKTLAKAVFIGAVSSLLISVIFICLMSVIVLTSGLLPIGLTNIVTIILLGIATLFGGFISAKITCSSGMITGLIMGFLVFLSVTSVGMIMGNDSVTMLTLIRFLTTVILGGAGGILGVNQREKIHIK